MRNLNEAQLLEIVTNAVIREIIKDPILYNKEDLFKRLDNSWRDRAFKEIFIAIDKLYASRADTANTILQCTTFRMINPGKEDEKKENIECYIYKSGLTYIVFKTLTKKE